MQSDLDRKHYELLRDFKGKMPQSEAVGNVSPFDNRVCTATSDPVEVDIPEMNAAARDYIREVIRKVRDEETPSQVVLIAGAAGTGKTHLLRTFHTPESIAEHGQIFVGGSNHWRINEFTDQLLDWVISALIEPTPSEDHPLRDRIRAIGFRAVELLLENPISWKSYLARRSGNRFVRFFRPHRIRSHERLKKMTAERDPRVFAEFDFAKFTAYVCDRFLAERSNLFHRYALRVLLLYLYPEPHETGIGPEERVLHWFRGRGDRDYFTRRLGAAERPDRDYSRMDAVKLFAHLFSPAVSRQLASSAFPCSPRVLLLTFDQAEGRNELFDSDNDWRDFFAHLSELYNTLPNIVVLFTMTLGLRIRLHSLMERQFRDRIRMDQVTALIFPEDEQLLKMYQSRVRAWLRNTPELLQLYDELGDPNVPFTREEMSAMLVRKQAIRLTLEQFDLAFRKKLDVVIVEPHLDYLYKRNEIQPAPLSTTDWNSTTEHIDHLRSFFEVCGTAIFAPLGIELRECSVLQPNNLPVLRLQLAKVSHALPVTIYLARLGYRYNDEIQNLINDYLYKREKDKHFLWVVRQQAFQAGMQAIDARYEAQVIPDLLPVELEAKIQALESVGRTRMDYDEASREKLDELIRTEIASTYLMRLAVFAREKCDAISKSSQDSANALSAQTQDPA